MLHELVSLGFSLELHPEIYNLLEAVLNTGLAHSGIFSSLLSDAVLLQKISIGIPLPPAQVPPNRLHVKQTSGSLLGQGPEWVFCEGGVPQAPSFMGVWRGCLCASGLQKMCGASADYRVCLYALVLQNLLVE